MGNKNKEPHYQAGGKKKKGFSLLKKKEDGIFFFRFYNEEGDLLLTSPPFPDEDRRKSSLKLVRQNAANLARFKRLTEGNLHYFIIRAGNNKSLAKSIGFDSKEAQEKAINQLHRAVIDKKPGISKIAAPVSKKPLTLSHTDPQAAEGQSRFNFDLTFYLQEKGERLIGKIEYPLDKEKVSFEGFDMQQIEAFILEHLPAQIKTAHATKDSAEQASPKAEVSKKSIEKPPVPVQSTAPKPAKVLPVPVDQQSIKESSLKAVAKSDNLDLVMIEKGQVVTKNIVHKSAAISFQIAVPKEFRDPNYQIEVAVHAKLMKGGSRLVFIGKKQTFPSSLELEQVRVPLTIYSLSPGVHRCIVNITFIHPNSPSKNQLLVGKKLVKIVEKESFLELALN